MLLFPVQRANSEVNILQIRFAFQDVAIFFDRPLVVLRFLEQLGSQLMGAIRVGIRFKNRQRCKKREHLVSFGDQIKALVALSALE